MIRRELDAVYEVSKTLATSLDVHKTFREALNYLLHAFDWRRTFVVVAEPDGTLKGLCAVGLTQAEQQRLHFESGEGIVGRVFASGMPATVPDVRAEPLFLNRTGAADQSPGIPVAMLATPIRADHRTLGVVVVDCLNPEGRRVFADDLRLLRMVATLMGQALLLHRSVTAAAETLQNETRRMHKALGAQRAKIDRVVGVSAPMLNVFDQIEQVAPLRTTVLLRGESGTGKEVMARAIHNLSPRAKEPFVGVNCAALTESLLESELFGHEKGAFTGAQGQRKGRFEMAHGGTLFLDEIGDISASFQAKLLRVLQERSFERVGGGSAVKVDVRLILATNRNLERMVQAGEFRADLYYRINVVSIQLPPLRERREDIPAMAQHFLERFNRENAKTAQFSPEAMRVLTSCYWPGNVRELENCVERTATMAHNDVISDLAFPCRDNRCLTQVLHHIEREDAVRPSRLAEIPIQERPMGPAVADPGLPPAPPAPAPEAVTAPPLAVDGKPDGEAERLVWAMERSGWVQAKAARLLKISPRQMGYALQKHGIEVRKF
ncbi:MAG: nif-specific transcriptional activator NifA [Hydrogenophaga sp.]|jgi:Nif-specific regulatory protein|uniref:nif-specific transcriptional activator NifA n=1 Tax=Hydrogenophaga sp. TaxID=1904254 RepID=UPI00271D6549|nr:nif-specific transcriptional activator NifA [Hydrogenophaga sp.]MDO9483898.1 nif-specific transcriptional activator NifA [Hydrogenophaga sp.]MDP2220815.1 nif-specific transcriptional activator NifA [Hydrogenophaga sp.]MDP3343579.1 nif-specific transcriptional activator NifA [Hydrogenophaga sp.]MDP3807803.1 nif-specific transcriptional activator NifA [Hydrogenophaga sp.]MDP3923866.1 nif-specific transcriptional activator NifA [Hydrogenophaga sp.]